MIAMNKTSTIVNNLDIMYPNPKCELTYNKDYELLLKVMLSAQTTDKRVNAVTDSLFKKYETIENYIKSLGMYKTKANNFLLIVSEISKLGYVPNDRIYLENLPGVGRKTTNVVLSNLYNVECVAVDTHVERVSKRLSLAKTDDTVLEVENKLTKKFSNYSLSRLHHQLVLFGRYKCKSKSPECTTCPFKEICNFYKKKKH